MTTWGPITVMVHDLLFLLLRVSKKRQISQLSVFVGSAYKDQKYFGEKNSRKFQNSKLESATHY